VAARSRDGVAARSAGVSESSHVGVDAGGGLSSARSRLSEILSAVSQHSVSLSPVGFEAGNQASPSARRFAFSSRAPRAPSGLFQ
jgi:hypothetical protein